MTAGTTTEAATAGGGTAVGVRRDGRVATVTVDRPPLNVLDLETIAALGGAFRHLAEEDLQVVVVRGAGRAFSAGVDVAIHTPERIEAMLTGFHGALRRLWALEAVTVAAVDGHCLGGGMELAAVCDLVIASDDSRFGQPEIKVGCYPPVAAALYPALLGAGPTFDLLLTGRTIDCAEAHRMGFVARRASRERFEEGLAELVSELTASSAAVARLAKKAIRAGRRDFLEALALAERIYLEELAATSDVAEGVAAFLEKRPPSWRHR